MATQLIEVDDIEQRALSVPEQAKSLKIVDDTTYQKGGTILVVIKGLRKEINETFDPVIAKANAAHKEACAAKKKVESPLVEAEAIIKPALAAYDAELERKAREEQRRLEEEARKRAEDEALAAAAHAEAEGNNTEAEAIINAPIEIAPIVQMPTKPKIEGVSYRDNWSAQVLDLKALVMAVAAGQQPINLLMPDMVTINKMAKALKGSLNIAGVKTVCTKVTAGRA